MTRTDISILNDRLMGLYGERFPGLTPEMALVWRETLHTADPEDIDRAVLRWARQQPAHFAPTLQNLVDTLELVEEDQARLRATAAHTTAQRSTQQILADAAMQAPPDLRGWAQGHCRLIEMGLGRPSNYLQTAAQCRVFVAEYPDDADAWEREVTWWEQQHQLTLRIH